MKPLASRLAAIHRRRAILAQLRFSPGQAAPAHKLRADLEVVHGQCATLDCVINDLMWLDDLEMVWFSRDENIAMLTECGREVVAGLRCLPGDVSCGAS